MKPWRPAALHAATVGLAALATASAAACFAHFGWPFELFVHFRWQLGIAALLGLVVAALSRRTVLLLLAVLTAVLQIVPPVLLAMEAPPAATSPVSCSGPAFTVATLNLEFDNRDPARAIAWLNAHPADVIVLQEVTRAWAAAIAANVHGYSNAEVLTREDPYGIAVLSRWPFIDVHAVDFAQDGLPSIVATLDVEGRTVEFFGLHTRWPIAPALQRSRDRAIESAADAARAAVPTTAIVAGDLNLTPFAPEFPRLLARSGLRDAFAGVRWRPTWRAEFWPLALPIDHVLVPTNACIVRREIAESVGSDHRPVLVTVRWQR